MCEEKKEKSYWDELDDTEVGFNFHKGEQVYGVKIFGTSAAVRLGLMCIIKRIAHDEEIPEIQVLSELFQMEIMRLHEMGELPDDAIAAFTAIPDAEDAEKIIQ